MTEMMSTMINGLSANNLELFKTYIDNTNAFSEYTTDIEYVIDRQLSLYVSERQFTRQIWKKYLIEGVFKFYRAI